MQKSACRVMFAPASAALALQGLGKGSSVSFGLHAICVAGKFYNRFAKYSLFMIWYGELPLSGYDSEHRLKWYSCRRNRGRCCETTPGTPWAAKAGSGIPAGRSMVRREAPRPGHAQGSVSMTLDKAMATVCCCTQARCRVLQKGPIVPSASSSNAEEPPSPSASTASTQGSHPQPVRQSCAQPAHFDTHLTRPQPTLGAPGDLSASPPYVTAPSQQTISTVTQKSFIFPIPSVFMFPQTCTALSTKLHFRHYLGYREVALLAWVTNPTSGGEIKPEPIFITFFKEKAAFSALQNNIRVCTVCLICNSNVQASWLDGSFRQGAFILSGAQHWEADPASCSSRGTKCTICKGKSCSPPTSQQLLPGILLGRGNSSPRGSPGMEVQPWTLIIPAQVIHEVAAGQEPKKV